MTDNTRKAVITVIGKDTVGIIAKVCTCLADTHTNILDISQRIVGGYLTMVMIVDVSKTTVGFDALQDSLESLGVDLGVQIRCQREEIFEMMHRI